MTTTTRFDHSNCDHPKSGNEGKKARAKCRKEHAQAALEAAKKPARKPRTAAVSKTATTPRKPRVSKVKETVPAAPSDDLDVPDL